MRKYVTSTDAPSTMFVDSLLGGGSYDTTCHCGRDHCCINSDNYQYTDHDNEYIDYLSNIQTAHKINPDGVVIHNDEDCVYWKEINNRHYVVGCPCNGLTQYEEFIWHDRLSIMRYIEERTKQEAQWLNEKMVVDKLIGKI